MLQHLVPVSKKHSIGNVSATIVLAQNVLKVETLFKKINDLDEIKFKYARRNLTHIQSININGGFDSINKVDKNVDGFLFESFDEIGRLKNILRLTNQNEKTTAITFETRRYHDWNSFFKDVIESITLISKFYPFYISAISLNYVDDFTWVNKEPIPVREIFNAGSELINNKFLNSEVATIVFQSQNSKQKNEIDNHEERIEISFSNRLKKIIINHQYAKKFDNLEYSIDIEESGVVADSFNKAHDINKEVIKDILSKDVLRLINII